MFLWPWKDSVCTHCPGCTPSRSTQGNPAELAAVLREALIWVLELNPEPIPSDRSSSPSNPQCNLGPHPLCSSALPPYRATEDCVRQSKQDARPLSRPYADKVLNRHLLLPCYQHSRPQLPDSRPLHLSLCVHGFTQDSFN